jgi:hypothetical protein
MTHRYVGVIALTVAVLVFAGCEQLAGSSASEKTSKAPQPTVQESFSVNRSRLMLEMTEAEKTKSVFLSTVSEVDSYVSVADEEFLRIRAGYRSMVDKENAKLRNQMKGSDQPTYQEQAVKWPSIGMSIDHANKVTDFGTIVDRNTTKSANVERVQIVYDYFGTRRYLYFVNGQLTSMQY